MKIILPILDIIIHVAANIARYALLFVALLLLTVTGVFLRTLRQVGGRGSISELAAKLSSANEKMLDMLKNASRHKPANIKELTSTEKGRRRLIAGALLLIFILASYPPSHWGPWYLYQKGTASYYADEFKGRTTANGEIFDPSQLTAAHKDLPTGITVLVINRDNKKSVYLKINDRGPYVKDRKIDLSAAAAEKLGISDAGLAEVDIYTRRSILR